MILLNNVTKVVDHKTILSNVSFNVNNSEIVGYVGPNGAGKTTTMKIIVGVSSPSSGDVEIDGYSIVKEKSKAQSMIGWVPEVTNFDENEKAINYFYYIASFYNIDKGEAKKIAEDLFSLVGLEGRENQKIKTFSQGMKRRFALALSLINNPRNLILDEPQNGLDPQGMKLVRELLIRMKNKGCAILFSSHLLGEMEKIADRIVFINKGKIVKEVKNKELSGVIRIVLKEANQDILKKVNEIGDVKIKGNVIYLKEGADLEDIIKLIGRNNIIELKQSYDLEELFSSIYGLDEG
ncbi:ABC transporter ATP-binding protein [Acidianus hospitalis]|uniref:ABC transporter ATP-binding protein n=1 Tax=Acidianus hospitalis TaxID=563177 RepID=A0A2T9XCM2_9CREN|nr:ABC transporter ATP-binding protein [Acidianus hospitalis]